MHNHFLNDTASCLAVSLQQLIFLLYLLVKYTTVLLNEIGTITSIISYELTLRREVEVKLTPDPINCLIFKNDFNLYRRDFATFNIYLLPSIWHT